MARNSLLNRFEIYLAQKNFRPGDKLPGEIELANEFGVSRTTIREIIAHLTLLGILERRTKAGTFIHQIGVDEISSVLAFQLRTLGCGTEELKSARRLLELSLVDEIISGATPMKLQELDAINQKLKSACTDPLEADRLDLEFHIAMLAGCGNRIYLIFSQVITVLFDAKYRDKFHSEKAIMASVRTHNEMISFLRQKDAAALKSSIESHIKPL